MISKYNDFLIEKNLVMLLEGGMAASDEFMGKLKSIKNKSKIADILYQSFNNLYIDKDLAQNWIDVSTDKDDTVTFLPDSKAEKADVSDDEALYTLKGRGEIKVGRFVRAILGDKTVISTMKNEFEGDIISSDEDLKFTDKEFEEFVNLYKSTFGSKSGGFEIVSGDKIGECYDEENYAQLSGTLGGSCMRHEDCQSYFKIYCKNPETCQLLVLKNGEDKVLGRAIVWTLSKSPIDGVTKFMDRIYTARDSDVNKFIKYADDNNWIIKYKMNSHDQDGILFKHKGKDIVGVAETKLSKVDFDEYPFMDTMCYVDKKAKTTEVKTIIANEDFVKAGLKDLETKINTITLNNQLAIEELNLNKKSLFMFYFFSSLQAVQPT